MSDKELEELRSELAGLRAELASMSQNRDSIIREKRELQDKLKQLKPTPPEAAAYTLTREEARDPARYRAAREAANKAGRASPIIIDPQAKQETGPAGNARTITTERAIYMRHDAAQDIRSYRRARDEAQRENKPLRMFRDRASLAAIADDDGDAVKLFDEASK